VTAEAVMADDTPKKGLGRGLSALLGDDEPPSVGGRAPRELPIEFLRPNRYQPRRRFDETELDELADSIREHGVVQPIMVRRIPDQTDAYEIVAGERRWRAAQRAQLPQVPVVIRDLSDSQSLEVAIVENVQRTDLSAIEEAKAYQRLAEDFSHTQEKIADLVGRSRSHVANTLRLLSLPAEVQDLVESGNITAGHARAILGAADPIAAARQVVDGQLNVRAAEELVSKKKQKNPPATKDADTLALESNLSQALGLRVAISHAGAKGGSVRIDYSTIDQLDDVCRRLIQNGRTKVE
jgi:ParB family chromosome partitioning protein